jgi:hypothetical protein
MNGNLYGNTEKSFLKKLENSQELTKHRNFGTKEGTSLLLIAICPGGGAGSACDGRETDLPHPIFNS